MGNPLYPQSLVTARSRAEQAIEFLVGHEIIPSPLNYSVAYEYFAGTNSELQQAIDKHLEGSNRKLEEFHLRDWYERFVASGQFNNLRSMGNDLESVLHDLLQNLAEAGDGVSAYGQALERQISELHAPGGPADIQAIAKELLSATLDARSSNYRLLQRLEETHEETEVLRSELEKHRREVLIDPLTGLYNRRGLDTHMTDLMASGAGTGLSLVMLDIDHFKRINDTYGHAVGDIVIRNIADTVKKCIRGEDIAVRFGGEEFLVLLPETPLKGALKVAETIRSRIESLRLVRRHDGFRLAPFTVSLGVAERRLQDTQESLFDRADRALYLSKQNGRNCVSLEEMLH